jgi:hypothetical protein
MANPDRPEGFRAVGLLSGGKCPDPRPYHASGGIALHVGEVVNLSSGLLVIPTTTVGVLLGVVAPQNGYTTLGTTIVSSATTFASYLIHDDADIVYEGQCSGTATSIQANNFADWEGDPGKQEINEDATTESTLKLLGWVTGPHGSRGALTVGANAVGRFIIARSLAGQQGPALS